MLSALPLDHGPLRFPGLRCLYRHYRSRTCAAIVVYIDKQDETALCSVYLALAGGKNSLTLSYKAVLVVALRKCCVITF